MIIVSQDKYIIANFANIEMLGIGSPLEDDDGKFKILANTISDNQYVIGKYETEERAKEVLKEIARFYKMFEGMKINADIKISIGVAEQIEKDGQDLHIYTLPLE